MVASTCCHLMSANMLYGLRILRGHENITSAKPRQNFQSKYSMGSITFYIIFKIVLISILQVTKSELQNINQTGVHFQGHDQVEGHQIIETEVTTTAPVQVCCGLSYLLM